MTDVSGAKVIVLQSHRAWAAAQRRERERSEAMRRHPSFLGQRWRPTRGDVGPPRAPLAERDKVLGDNLRVRALRVLR